MDCDGIEITLNGHSVCLPRYWQKIELPPRKPDPDPGPFRDAFNDVAILATIAQGLAQISNDRVRATLRDAVQDGFRTVDLPKGMKVGRGVMAGLERS